MSFQPRLARRAIAALALATAGLGAAGAVAATTLSPHSATRNASSPVATKGDFPYFICISWENQWGLCVGPPTN